MRLFLDSQLLLVFISVLALTRAQTTTETTTDTATTETTTAQPTEIQTTSGTTTETTAETTTETTAETTAETTTAETTTETTAETTAKTTTETTAETTTAETTSETTTAETTTETTTAETTTETTTTETTTAETTTETTTAETTTETTTAETTSETTTAETTAETTTTETTTPETTTETTTVLPETTTTETTTVLTPVITAEPTTTPLTETTTKTTTVLPATTTATTTVSTTIPTTTAWTAPAIFYPFGSVAGDTEQLESGGETYRDVNFSTPFTFFGRKYNYTYVNNNGLLTFSQPLPEASPFPFPTYGAEDFIAPLWTDLDDIGIGRYSYQQYTNGSVLTRATQDINQYFPHKGFSASWVFVATWDYVLTSDMNILNLHSAPAITFQVVLISGGDFSFILMNYGECAEIYLPVEAGYDTIDSTDYYVIHYDASNGSSIPNLKNTSNVNVPGRWAFLVNNGTENVIGVQIKLRSFLDLRQSGNFEVVLQKIKQELVNRGVPSFVELKLRDVKKTQP